MRNNIREMDVLIWSKESGFAGEVDVTIYRKDKRVAYEHVTQSTLSRINMLVIRGKVNVDPYFTLNHTTVELRPKE